MREIRYRTIADDLRRRIEAGELGAGAVLPSESDLARRHGVSRVTVRKALEVLRTEDLVDSRQGFGWFVAGPRVRQSLASLGTIEGQLEADGHRPERRVLRFGFVPAPARVAEVLGAGTVLEVTRLNLADGAPFALVTVWCPEALASHLSRDAVESQTFYELLHVDFGSATQTIGAALAGDADAEALEVPVGSPLLVCERASRNEAGTVVLVSEHRFPAHLTEFVVELAATEPSLAPSGLRLVHGDG